MREQRNREARELIGGRVDAAKALFVQNSAAAQMANQKAAPIKPVRNSIAQRITSLQQQQQLSEPSSQPQPPQNVVSNNVVDVEEVKMSQVINETESAQPTNVVNNKNSISSDHELPVVDDSDAYSTIKRSPFTKSNSGQQINSTSIERSEPIKSETKIESHNGNSTLVEQKTRHSVKGNE